MIYQLKSKSIGSKEVLPEEEEMVVTFKWDILSLNQIKSHQIRLNQIKSNQLNSNQITEAKKHYPTRAWWVLLSVTYCSHYS